MKARYFESKKGGVVQCALCPNRCRIPAGRSGNCRVRLNRDGELEIPFYGHVSSIAVDPIEKKPLYHFHPGVQILSVGFVGCSFHCPFCQNYRISQSTSVPTEYLAPEALVSLAQDKGSFGISYTYSEPLIHLEYVLDASRLARAKGLKNVLVTNGYVNPEPAEELLEVTDAANIDLKTHDPEFYSREIGGRLEEVKRFISQAVGRVFIEVTTLVIPTKTDGAEQIEAIARFLAGLDPQIPFHLSAYYPQYHYRIPPTPPSTLRSLAEVARRHLRYVYLGNIGLEETNTFCASCGSLLVRRSGYSVSLPGIKDGRCRRCSTVPPLQGL